MEKHSEYVFNIDDIRNLISDPVASDPSYSVSITINFQQDVNKDFKAKILAKVVNSSFDDVGIPPKHGCPRPPGCP
ncbi:hypothetical protein PZB74_17935 [Porifericola rhodea]|uniref:hypothetical protein n=1 Tax=Porifericola rhodea TaxID=930972 RepID=UPI002665E1EF|nr:hypothetical protein [Porifericola rhodea]WKN30839.1 hypothetical protein PZB74_17935 [Porifericola rhodea]